MFTLSLSGFTTLNVSNPLKPIFVSSYINSEGWNVLYNMYITSDGKTLVISAGFSILIFDVHNASRPNYIGIANFADCDARYVALSSDGLTAYICIHPPFTVNSLITHIYPNQTFGDPSKAKTILPFPDSTIHYP